MMNNRYYCYISSMSIGIVSRSTEGYTIPTIVAWPDHSPAFAPLQTRDASTIDDCLFLRRLAVDNRSPRPLCHSFDLYQESHWIYITVLKRSIGKPMPSKWVDLPPPGQLPRVLSMRQLVKRHEALISAGENHELLSIPWTLKNNQTPNIWW